MTIWIILLAVERFFAAIYAAEGNAWHAKRKKRRQKDIVFMHMPPYYAANIQPDPFKWIKMFALIARSYLNGSIYMSLCTVKMQRKCKESKNLSSKITFSFGIEKVI